MGDRLLDAVVINHRKTRGFAAGTCRCGDRGQRNGIEAVFIFKIVFRRLIGRKKLDDLGGINSAATAYGDDDVALFGTKQLHSFNHILVARVG